MNAHLNDSDHLRLISTEGLDIMGELLRLNQTKMYYHSLDVVRLYRSLHLERVKFFLGKKN